MDGAIRPDDETNYVVQEVHGVRRVNGVWEAWTEWQGEHTRTWEDTVPHDAAATVICFLLDAFRDIGQADPRFVEGLRRLLDE